jgi:hypothetical protein
VVSGLGQSIIIIIIIIIDQIIDLFLHFVIYYFIGKRKNKMSKVQNSNMHFATICLFSTINLLQIIRSFSFHHCNCNPGHSWMLYLNCFCPKLASTVTFRFKYTDGYRTDEPEWRIVICLPTNFKGV